MRSIDTRIRARRLRRIALVLIATAVSSAAIAPISADPAVAGGRGVRWTVVRF